MMIIAFIIALCEIIQQCSDCILNSLALFSPCDKLFVVVVFFVVTISLSFFVLGCCKPNHLAPTRLSPSVTRLPGVGTNSPNNQDTDTKTCICKDLNLALKLSMGSWTHHNPRAPSYKHIILRTPCCECFGGCDC